MRIACIQADRSIRLPDESYIRSHTGWLTTSVTLLEAGAVLRKVYAVAPALAAQKLAQLAAAPIMVFQSMPPW